MSYSPLWDTALQNVVGDTTPQLGGNLDVQANAVTTTVSNGNIVFTMNGTGVINVGSGYEANVSADGDLVTKKWIDDKAYIADITAEDLTDLSDVTIAGAATWQLLVWDGAKWENQEASEQGLVIENGFENRTDSTLVWTDSTPDRTLTITGTFTVYSGGKRWDITGPDAIQIDAAADDYFIYYDETGTLTFGTDSPGVDPDLLDTYAYVAGLRWDGTNALIITDERHGRIMDSDTHRYLHTVFGTQYVSGVGLGTMSTDDVTPDATSTQAQIADGLIRDEDIGFDIENGSPQTLSGTPAEVPLWYRDTVSGTWKQLTATTHLVHPISGAGTRASWNDPDSGGAGVWGLTAVADGEYVLTHLFATTNILAPVIGIIGQATHSTATAARDAAETEIGEFTQGDLAAFVQESTPIGSVIIHTDATFTGNTNRSRIITTNDGSDYQDFRGAFGGGGGGGGTAASDHGVLTGLGDDDHSQYHNDLRGDLRYYKKTESDAVVSTPGAKINKTAGTTSGQFAEFNGTGELQAGGGYSSASFASASHAHAASDVTSGTFADARIAEGNVTQHEAALDILESQITEDGNTYVLQTEAGAVNGVATLDGAGKVPSAQIPPIAITETYVVADQAGRLGLSATPVQEGDIAVQTDNSTTYIMNGSGDGSAVGHWTILATPTSAPVQSVDGLTGTVDLSSKYLQHVHQDLTPQLGADLDVNTYAITGIDASPVATGTGGSINIETGIGGSTSGNAGDIFLTPGTAAGTGSDGAIVISATSAPAVTTNKLYNIGGSIYWNAIDLTLAATGLQNVVEDVTPQLGGNLDVNGKSIVSVDDSGVAVLVTAGGDTNNTGGASKITLQGGNVGTSGGAGLPGAVEIFAGNNLKTSGNVSGGSVDIQGGSATGGSLTDGGSIFLRGGVGSDEGGNIILQPGDDETDNSDNGYVLIQPRNDGFAPELRILGDTGTTFNYISFKAGDMSAGLTKYTLPTAFPASGGYALVSTTGGVMSWANLQAAGSYLENVLEDTSPQLGGILDVNDFCLVGKAAGDGSSPGGEVCLTGAAGGASSGAGGAVDIDGGAGGGTGDGGAVEIDAGTGGTTGDGGIVNVTAGAGGATSGAGGKVDIDGGAGGPVGAGGDVDVTGGAGGATSGAGGSLTFLGGEGDQGGDVSIYGGESTGSNPGGAIFMQPGKGDGSAPTIPTPSGAVEPTEFWFVDAESTPGYVGLAAPADVSAGNTGDGANTVWTLPEGDGAAGEVLSTDGGGVLSWFAAAPAAGGTYLEDVVDDLSPQLGGDLDLYDGSTTHKIVTTSGSVLIEPTLQAGFQVTSANVTGTEIGGNIVLQVGTSVNGNAGSVTIRGGRATGSGADGTIRLKTEDGVWIENYVNGEGAAELRFREDSANGLDYVGFKAPADLSDTTTSYTLPGAFPAATYVLQSTTGGVMSWVNPTSFGLQNVHEDLSPQLGADLDPNDFNIVSSADLDSTGTDVFLIQASDAVSGAYAQTLEVVAGDIGSGSTATQGGEVLLKGGNSARTDIGANAGGVELRGGDSVAHATLGGGGSIELHGGDGKSVGGSIQLTPGADTTNHSSDGSILLFPTHTGQTAIELRFYEDQGGDDKYTSIRGASSQTANTDYILPAALPTTTGQVLSSSTIGTMSWVDQDATTGIVINKSADYTVAVADTKITVDASGGDVTISLHAASTARSDDVTIKRIDASGNTVTVDLLVGTDDLEGTTGGSVTITTQYASLTFASNTSAAEWWIF